MTNSDYSDDKNPHRINEWLSTKTRQRYAERLLGDGWREGFITHEQYFPRFTDDEKRIIESLYERRHNLWIYTDRRYLSALESIKKKVIGEE